MSARRTKFYLDKQNGKWMGVCSGIADYTGIDVVWVRVGAVLVTLMGAFPWTLIQIYQKEDTHYLFQTDQVWHTRTEKWLKNGMVQEFILLNMNRSNLS